MHFISAEHSRESFRVWELLLGLPALVPLQDGGWRCRIEHKHKIVPPSRRYSWNYEIEFGGGKTGEEITDERRRTEKLLSLGW